MYIHTSASSKKCNFSILNIKTSKFSKELFLKNFSRVLPKPIIASMSEES